MFILLSSLKKAHFFLNLQFKDQIIYENCDKLLNFEKNTLLSRINLFVWYYFIIKNLVITKQPVNLSYKVSVLNPFVRKLIILLVHLKADKMVTILDKLLFSRCKSFTKQLKLLKPKLLIVPGSAMDSSSFLGLRSAKKVGVMSLMVVTHWDYFSKKGIFRELPDFLFVWGKSMMKTAIQQGYPKGRIFSVGFPFFDFDNKMMKPSKLKRSSKNCLRIFFAGSGMPFCEESAIETICFLLKRERQGARVTYRPHPRGTMACRSLQMMKRKNFSKVLLSSPTRNENEEEATRNILRKSDGLITPASTMLLQAGCYGLPSLCLIYDDGVNDHLFPFSFAAESEHIKSIQDNPYVIFVYRKQDLPHKLEEFLELIKKSPNPWKIRQSFKHIFENAGTQSSRDFVEKALKKILATK